MSVTVRRISCAKACPTSNSSKYFPAKRASSTGLRRRDAVDPGAQRRQHLGSVALVEHFVARTAEDMPGDVCHSSLAIAVQQRLKPGKLRIDGIKIADEQVQRQVAADVFEFGGGEPRRVREQRTERLGLDGEAAQGIGDVFVDFRRVATQPLERRSRRLERRVEVLKPPFSAHAATPRRSIAAVPESATPSTSAL